MTAPWFVVGGAGFIGTNLAKRRDCTVYDLLDCRRDALDYPRLVENMDGHEVVVHLAANADIAAGATNPDLDLDGITITRNVCRAAREVGVKRIIYTSGSGVYGYRCPSWPTEDTACYPVSSYGASKLASEAILLAYEQYGIDVTIFRPANVVGPDQTHGVGYDFMRLLRDDPLWLPILGDGKQSKQYLHVDDLLDAFEIAPRGTFNVAPDDALTVMEIAELACFQLGLQHTTFAPKGGLAWPGDIPVVRLDCTKLRGYGWSARPSGRAMCEALAHL